MVRPRQIGPAVVAALAGCLLWSKVARSDTDVVLRGWFGRVRTRPGPVRQRKEPAVVVDSVVKLRGGSLESSKPWWIEEGGSKRRQQQQELGKASNGILAPSSTAREETMAPWWTDPETAKPGGGGRGGSSSVSGSVSGSGSGSGSGPFAALGNLAQNQHPWLLLLAAPALIFAGGVTHGAAAGPSGNVKKVQQKARRSVIAAAAASPPPPPRRRPSSGIGGGRAARLPLSPARQSDLSAVGVLAAAAASGWWIYQLYVTNALISSWPLSFLEPWQALALATWAGNMFAVSRRGRIDGEQARSTGNTGSDLIRFFTPAGWAFAIWGPIFLGELLYIVYQSLPGSAFWLADLCPFFAGAMASQILWCFAFRPWAANTGKLWLPASLLTTGAVCLAGAHRVLRAASLEGDVTPLQYGLVHLPLSLHFGWLSAASLVSWNGFAAALPRLTPGARLALSLASCYAAAALGSFVSLTTGDPVYAAVLAWALAAVASPKGWSKLKGVVDTSVLEAQAVTAKLCSASLAAVAAGIVGQRAISAVRGMLEV